MRYRLKVRALCFGLLLSPPVCSAAASQTGAPAPQTPAAPAPAKPAAKVEAKMLRPSDFFADFPEVAWGMKFQDAWKAVEKTGARPVRFKEIETEFAWEGKFAGMDGRAAVHLRDDGGGVFQITVGVYAMERREEVFKAWGRRLAERHGPAQEEETEFALEHLWRLKDGFAILLRTLKDANNPVVEIRWVKE